MGHSPQIFSGEFEIASFPSPLLATLPTQCQCCRAFAPSHKHYSFIACFFYCESLLHQFFLNLLLWVFVSQLSAISWIIPPILTEPFSRSERTSKRKEIVVHLSEVLPAHQTGTHLGRFGKCLLKGLPVPCDVGINVGVSPG